MKIHRTILTALLLPVLVLVACGSEADDTASIATTTSTSEAAPSASGEPDEVDDVTIVATRVDGIGDMLADLQFANDSSKPSSYNVQVDFLDAAGTKIASGYAFAQDVQPGATATAEVLTASEPPGDGVFTARVASVDRMAS